ALHGMVFKDEPMTDSGGPLPTASNAALNAVRTSEVLNDLVAPVGGVQSLKGSTVVVSDFSTPTVAPPTEPAGLDFNFDARTNGFAATNAYYHCDTFFRLVQSLGFNLSAYFGSATFLPMPVDARGHIATASGLEINACCLGTSGGLGLL